VQNFTITMQSQLLIKDDDRPHQIIIETVAAETLAEAIAASQKRWAAPDYVLVSAVVA